MNKTPTNRLMDTTQSTTNHYTKDQNHADTIDHTSN